MSFFLIYVYIYIYNLVILSYMRSPLFDHNLSSIALNGDTKYMKWGVTFTIKNLFLLMYFNQFYITESWF